jgi:hypothetical protein
MTSQGGDSVKRILMAATACLFAVPAAAQTVVEEQTEMRNSWVILDPGEEAAQTFTNTTGSPITISGVKVWISRAWDGSVPPAPEGKLWVEIQGVNGSGMPDGSVEAFVTHDISDDFGTAVPNPNSPPTGPYEVAITSNPIPDGGQRALVLRVVGGTYNLTRVQWAGTDTDAYAAGEAFSRTTGESSVDYPGYDIDRHFQIVVGP